MGRYSARLTVEQFRALTRLRGYSLAALARLWGLTRARLSQIAADPARAAHYDFALRGTPRRRRGTAGESRVPASAHALPRAAAPLQGLELGEVFIVRDSPGEHLPEGEEGVLIHLSSASQPARARLRFAPGGYEESFEVPYLLSPDSFLVRTGRLRR